MPSPLVERVLAGLGGEGLPGVAPEEQNGRLTGGNRLLSALDLLTSGESLAGAIGLPSFPKLPGGIDKPIRFALDQVVSPLGLALTAAAPITGGASLGLKGALGGVARFGTRLLPEAGVAAAATVGGKAVGALIPEDAPAPLQLGGTLLGGLLGAVTAAGAVRGLVRAPLDAAVRSKLSEQAAEKGLLHIFGTANHSELATEIGSDHRVLAKLSQVFGIDPSKAIEDSAERSLLALARHQDINSGITSIALAKASPTGFRSFTVDAKGFVTNLPRGGKIPLGDVMSTKNAVERFALRGAQEQDWKAAHEVIDDLRKLLDDAGVSRPIVNEVGRLYFPRSARSKGGVRFQRSSDPTEARMWDDLTAAASNEQAEIIYDNLPETLSAYTKAALDEIATKQFDDAIMDFAVDPFRATIIAGKVEGRPTAGQVSWGKLKKAKKVEQRQRARIDKARDRGAPTNELADMQRALKVLITDTATKQVDWNTTLAKTYNTLPGSALGRGAPDEIPVKLWKNTHYLPSRSADKLNEWIGARGVSGPQAPKLIEGVKQVGDLMRFAAATADFAMPFVQGLPLLARNPVAWGKMSARHIVAFFNPRVQGRYIQKNFDSINDMVVKGRVPPGDVEFFKSLERGGLAERLGVKRVPGVTRFQTSYDTGLLITRHELWSSIKPRWNGTDEQLGKFVRNATGGLESRALGLGPAQRGVESMALFAPKLLRATLALVTDAARPWTPQGGEAAHTILRMLAAGAGIMAVANIGFGLAQGDTNEEIEQRLEDTMNPTKGRQFLGVQVGDNWYGIGGQVRSITQMIVRAVDDPKGLTSADLLDNPFARFAQGRMSPAASVAGGVFERLTNENVNVLPFETIDDWPDVGRLIGLSSLPFMLQGMVEGGVFNDGPSWLPIGIDSTKLSAPTLELFGSRTSVNSPSDVLDAEARDRFGLPFRDLTGEEQESIEVDFPEQVERREEFGDKAEKEHRANRETHNDEANATMLGMFDALQQGRLTREQFADGVQDTLHDRFLRNKTSQEVLGIEFGDSDSDKRRVLDAYFTTFDEAGFVPGSTQVDWDRWEELQADLDKRIEDSEFGNPARARQQLEERRRFDPPEELNWFFDNKELIDESGYWEVKDTIFELVRPTIARLGIAAESARELELLMAQAAEAGERREFATLRQLINRINSVTSTRRQQLRARSPELDRALRENGVIDIPLTSLR